MNADLIADLQADRKRVLWYVNTWELDVDTKMMERCSVGARMIHEYASYRS